MTPHKPAPCPVCGTQARQLIRGVFDCLKCERITFEDGRKAELAHRITIRRKTVRSRCQNVEYDHQARAYPGQLSPVGRVPAEMLIDALDFYLRGEKFDLAGYCRRCESDDQNPSMKTEKRPLGTLSRDGCAGCILSYLDNTDDPAPYLLRERDELRKREHVLETVLPHLATWRLKRRAAELLDEVRADLSALARKIQGYYPTFSSAETATI